MSSHVKICKLKINKTVEFSQLTPTLYEKYIADMYVLMGGFGNRFKAYFDLILDFHARKNIKMEITKMGKIKKAYNERMGRLKTIVEEKEDELKVLLEDVKHKKHLLYDLMSISEEK
ncbi:hypothetical protein L1987_85975 [Smallanthus sonchifolius]|uniref:Uncharacterized protein n=1 Tax=Smallanthus sonchifolius TaxID=185202 RepID=A0ACB8XZL2_9ASTR|nr:hypothetical protein L1987_85975 [Smallanthus sonchifolius]